MQTDLRKHAEDRIKAGNAPRTRGSPTGAQALTLLHSLASAPGSASDALKLLHELQVHQVELDLQHEQAEDDRRQLAQDLENFAALFELAPFAYLRLDPEGRVIAANRLAADWLVPAAGASEAAGGASEAGGEDRADRGESWAGRRIEDLLASDCRPAIRSMLTALRRGEGRQTCALQSRAGGVSVQAVATAKPGGGQVLMAVVPAELLPAH